MKDGSESACVNVAERDIPVVYEPEWFSGSVECFDRINII